MTETKIRYVAFGVCSKCGKEFIRPPECDVAVCDCESAIEVPLHPVLILKRSLLLRKLEQVCPPSVSLEDFVNAIFEVAIEQLDKGKINIEELKQ